MSTATFSVDGALPVRPVTAIGDSTVALSAMVKLFALVKVAPGGGGGGDVLYEPVSVTPENVEYARTITCHVPAVAVGIAHVSLLPPWYGRQSYVDVVGAAP